MTLFVFDSDHLSLHQRGHEAIRKRLLTVPRDQVAINATLVTRNRRDFEQVPALKIEDWSL